MFPLGDAEGMKTRLLQLEQENTKVIASLWIVCQIRQGIRKKLETYKSRYLRNLKTQLNFIQLGPPSTQ